MTTARGAGALGPRQRRGISRLCPRSGGLRQQLAHADQIVCRRREGEGPLHPLPASVSRLARQRHRFHPPEHRLDPPALLLADAVANLLRSGRRNGAPQALARRVRLGVRLPAFGFDR